MSQPPAGPGGSLRGPELIAAALLLGLANFMVVLDTTIANVSVPHIAGGLAVSPTQGTWVITSYSVAEAISVPLTGWLVQRFGVVKVFTGALLGFGFFSFLCGLAPSFAALLVLRVLQGLVGGPIMPTSQTLLMSIFPREKTGQAMSLWAMTTVTAPIAGPLLGGFLSDGLGWSWIFFINVPVVIAISFGVVALLRRHETPTRRVPVDYVGLGLLILWVGSLQMMLDRGRELEWFASGTIVALAVMAAIGFACFLIWELTAENPIVDLRIFRHRGFTVGVTVVSLGFGSFFASAVLIPLWLQTSMGYTATWAGRAAALNGVLAVVMAPIVGRLARRVDARVLIMVGITGMGAVTFWRTFFSTSVGFWDVAITFLVQGAVVPFFFMSSSMLTLTSVKPEETASAAGLSNFMRTSGAAFATSLTTTMWENIASARRAELVGRLNDVPGAMEVMTRQGLSTEQARAQVEQLVQAQAVMLATNQLMWILTGVFLMVVGIIWLSPKPARGGFGVASAH